jgi:hypothetical protein
MVTQGKVLRCQYHLNFIYQTYTEENHDVVRGMETHIQRTQDEGDD